VKPGKPDYEKFVTPGSVDHVKSTIVH
jgi:hypothetical protein